MHSSIGFKPNDVNKRNEHLVRRLLYPKIVKEKRYSKAAFKLGDTVRLAGKKAAFQKGMNKLTVMRFSRFQRSKIDIPKLMESKITKVN